MTQVEYNHRLCLHQPQTNKKKHYYVYIVNNSIELRYNICIHFLMGNSDQCEAVVLFCCYDITNTCYTEPSLLAAWRQIDFYGS